MVGIPKVHPVSIAGRSRGLPSIVKIAKSNLGMLRYVCSRCEGQKRKRCDNSGVEDVEVDKVDEVEVEEAKCTCSELR